MRDKARVRHISICTEALLRLLDPALPAFFKGEGAWRHLATAGTVEVEGFLTDLGVVGQ